MNIIKIYLILVFILQFIDYNKNIKNIILIINASLTEYKTVLMQINRKIKEKTFYII